MRSLGTGTVVMMIWISWVLALVALFANVVEQHPELEELGLLAAPYTHLGLQKRKALETLQQHSPVPVIGVIEPGVRSLVSATRNGHVGVIGTRATIHSGAYERALRRERIMSAHQAWMAAFAHHAPLPRLDVGHNEGQQAE